MTRTILITGAAGNIGSKITAHFRQTTDYALRLLDKTPVEGIVAADFGIWDEAWAKHFAGVDTVIHLAGNPHGNASWASVKRDNITGTQHVLRAAREAKVGRVIFASTNQVMLGYRFATGPVTTDMPPAPLSPYGISKFACEEIGRAFNEETGIDFLAVRIGYFQGGENVPGAGLYIGAWGQSMWVSNRDMNQFMERAVEARSFGFAIVNLESNNIGMRWDIEHTRKVVGYVPLDTAPAVMGPLQIEQDETAQGVRVAPGTWLDENFGIVDP
jgi:NAD+ dependent glucose-6-phosphate dehydrogenase